ncbi:MAG: filamentous hemagglutinin N-terminal domain-containing protein, partial [Polynucleobacter sp.]
MGLNKSFRIIWSYCQSAWVVVGECTAGKGKSKGKSLRCQILLAAPAYLLMHETSLAQVQGLLEPTVRAGQAYVSQTSPNRLVIEQQSQRAVIDWKNFSIAQGQSLQFIQPSARSIALNRVTGQQASIIEGQLSANGQVWVLNPQGVIIGKQGRVDTQGFLATTLGLSNEDFLQGSYRFSMAHHSQGSATATGVIQNNGTINTPGAYAVLASDEVINNGLIQARLGTIALASGEAMTLDFVGDQLLRVDITEPIRRARAGGFAIENLGMLSAQGGQVLLTARGTKDVLNQAINTQGLIEATSAKLINGSIVLDGGASGLVQVDGSLNVSGMQAGERGGSVRVIGAGITLSDKAMLDARGDLGGGIIHLGGGWQGALAEGHSPAIRNYVAAGATLDASAVNEGNGGEIVVWSDVKNSNAHTWALGTFAATGGLLGGHGGRIETSGYGLSVNGIRVNAAATSGKAGEWLLDPVDITISDQPTNISSGVFGGTGTESFLQVSGLFGGTSDNSGLYPGTSGLIGSTDFFSQNSTTTVISPSTITSGLASSNVTIRTANGSTTESGNIYINSNINFPDISNRTLYLLADGVITSNSSSITINGPASTTNKGTVVFAQGGNSSFQGRLTRNLDFVKSGVGELTLTQTQWGTSDGQAAFIEQGSLITNANNNQRGTLGYASDIVIGPGAEVRVSGQQENSYVGTDAYPRTTIEAGGKLRDASNDSGQSRANHLGEMVLAGGSIESTNSNTSWATWLFDKKVTAKANTLSSISGGNMSLNKSSEIAVEGNAELYISSNINS